MDFKRYIKKYNEYKIFSFLIPDCYKLFLKIPNFKRLTQKQIDLLKLYEKEKFIMVSKARQTGETLITTGFLVQYALDNKNSLIGIVNSCDSERKFYLEILEKLTPIISKSYNEIKLENGSIIKFYSHTNFFQRGYTNNFDVIYISSASHYNNEERLMEVQMLLKRGPKSKLIICGEPKRGSSFNDIFKRDNCFVKFNLNFLDNPVNTEGDIRRMQDAVNTRFYSIDDFNQEILNIVE